MNEAVKMHAIINCNRDTFICLPSLLQAPLRDTVATTMRTGARLDDAEDFGRKPKHSVCRAGDGENGLKRLGRGSNVFCFVFFFHFLLLLPLLLLLLASRAVGDITGEAG